MADKKNSKKKEINVLRVKSSSEVQKVAGCIAACLQNGDTVEIHAIGAAAGNQSVKALAISRGMLGSSGIDIAVIPAFSNVQEEDGERTMIVLKIIELR